MRSTVYYTARVVQWVCTAMVPLLVWACRASDTGFESFDHFLSMVQARALWWGLGLALIGLVANGLTQFLGPPWVKAAIQRVLDRLQSEAYARRAEDLVRDHRITLFRHHKLVVFPKHWRMLFWPWSGWLVPVARSGHTTQRTTTVFRAPDDGIHFEGVAGLAWSRGNVVDVELPEVPSSTDPSAVREFARQQFLPERVVRKWILAGRLFPRTLRAIPVFVDNRIWGVLVLDSQRENAIQLDEREWGLFQRLAIVGLTELLKRV